MAHDVISRNIPPRDYFGGPSDSPVRTTCCVLLRPRTTFLRSLCLVFDVKQSAVNVEGRAQQDDTKNLIKSHITSFGRVRPEFTPKLGM